MKTSLALFAAVLVAIPTVATSQLAVPEPQPSDRVPLSLVLAKSNRAGITAEGLTGEPRANRFDPDTAQSHGRANDRGRANPDTADKHVRAGTRVAHAVAGGLVGILAGGAIGAAIGGYQDRHSQTHDDYQLPKSAVGGVLGAAVGLVLGLIIGADWP